MPKPTKEPKPVKPTKEPTDTASEVEAEEPTETEEEFVPPADATEVRVRYINPQSGETIRAFTEELHGDDFAATAEEFKSKFSGTYVPA